VRGAHRLLDAGPHWGCQKNVDELRIELRFPSLDDGVDGGVEAARRTITSLVRYGVEAVGNCDDPRFEGNSAPFEPSRITLAVPALVVRDYASRQVGIKRCEWLQYFGSALGVGHYGAPLLRCELRGLVKNVGEGTVQFSDIVKERDTLDTVQPMLIQAGCLAEDERIAGDASHVRAGFGVVCINRIEECLQRRSAQSLGLRTQGVFADHESGRRCSD